MQLEGRVESGRPVLQAALSGTSAAFDARGRRLAWAPGDWRGAGMVELPLSAERTPSARRRGVSCDWWGAMSSLVTAVSGRNTPTVEALAHRV